MAFHHRATPEPTLTIHPTVIESETGDDPVRSREPSDRLLVGVIQCDAARKRGDQALTVGDESE
jgi:hypothetical protein